MTDMPTDPRFQDLTGKKYGRLVVIGFAGRSPGKSPGRSYFLWVCECECSATCTVDGCSLRSGNTKSCGCLARDRSILRSTTHGKAKLPEYRIWSGIISRCLNPTRDRYRYYGARGITIAPEWRNDFTKFLEHVGPRPSPKHEIDRIDNNGHYEPGNVRWVTHRENCRNKRGNRIVEYDGQSRTLVEWAEILGVSHKLVSSRINALGWDPVRALTTPAAKRRPYAKRAAKQTEGSSEQ